jgi:hypothetical protein
MLYCETDVRRKSVICKDLLKQFQINGDEKATKIKNYLFKLYV